MGIHRLKHTFTAGELTPLLFSRSDFPRYQNGCKRLKNAVCLTQGPATSRSGFQFIFDLSKTGMSTSKTTVRLIPFIFNELQAYALVFFYDENTGEARAVIGTGEGIVVYPSGSVDCPPGNPITPTPGDPVIIEFPQGFSIENFDYAQSADEVVFSQPGLAPHVLSRYSPYCWLIEEIIFTDPPADWSDQSGWPEKVTMHQQRLTFGANATRRQTVWMSKSGSFYDFGEEVGDVLPSDSVTFTLDSGTQNRIQWLVSTRSLNVGTLGNEWTVNGSGSASITPGNLLAQRHTNNGSESVTPLIIGSTTIYLERFGRTANEFVYDYSLDGYKSVDLSILAEHLTSDYGILDWTYQQTPDNIIWSVREDGNLLGITYQVTHQVVGWHCHDTDGQFLTITSIPGNHREDEIWVVVKREIDSVDKYYLEKMSTRFKSKKAQDGRFLDCHVVYDGVPTNTVTGLDFLEGKEVHILADGTVHPPQTIKSGTVWLNAEYSTIVIGLGYIVEIRPLLPEINTEKGTSKGRMQRPTHLDIDFYDSLGVYFGKYDSEDGEYEEELPFRVPGDLMDEQVPLYSGIYHVTFPEGFDRGVEYFIRQYQPLPLTIRGIVDTVEVFD